MYYYKMKYSLSQMKEYISQGKAIEATMGGLILGRSHDNGGIYFWVKEGDYYSLEGEVEGYEYILNLGATSFFKESSKRLHQYEKHKHQYKKHKTNFEEYFPQAHIKVLDTRHESGAKFLLLDNNGFAIVNKYSAKGYLNTLDKMNRAVSYKIINENLIDLVFNNTDPIEIKFYDEFEGNILINTTKTSYYSSFKKWISFSFLKKHR